MSKQHNMKLYDNPFNLIRDGLKTIEVRCYDEKRKQVEIGDTIIFTHYDDEQQTIRVIVRDMQIFNSFAELYSSFPMSMFGYNNVSVEDMVMSARDIYNEEQEKQYGVIAIIFEKE